jgi:2-methylisocitrate lyase-like PEP mutase family enzyme
MSSAFNQFKKLHHASDLFILPNAWNAKSARLFQEQNFPAIATSSAAVANSLGYEDGEEMTFAEYLLVIKRILSAIQAPLTVDIETGYGATDEEIYANIKQLADLGVAGINIEDSIVNKSGRKLKDAASFARIIESVKNKLTANNTNLFINVRCDTFILNVPNKLQESIQRVQQYKAAGADGIFLPCIAREEDILTVINHTNLPLNVMCIPGLPGFEELNNMGVKRVSMGNFFFNKLYDNIGTLSRAIAKAQNFEPILS